MVIESTIKAAAFHKRDVAISIKQRNGPRDHPTPLPGMAPPLSPDIIDCVFTSLPDFLTLLSAILVSKSFHRVFQAHPSSILTSVAKTQIGPELLPCAIRLAHFDRDEYLASRADYVQDFPSERKFSHNEAPTVAPYIAALVKNDSVVTELELFFSTTCVLLSICPGGCVDSCLGNRCKDRKSGARSLLSPRESLRFRRAFYRWWLLNDLFPSFYLRKVRERADDEDEGDTGDDDDPIPPTVYLEKSQGLRRRFFREFSDDEVAEMWQVHGFMTFLSVRAQYALPGALFDRALLTLFMLHPWILNLRQISYHGVVPLPPRNSYGPSGLSMSRRVFRRSNLTGSLITPTRTGRASLPISKGRTTIRPRLAPTSGIQF